VEVAEIRRGLWRWTLDHPAWEAGEKWDPAVGSVFAELPDAALLIDPLVPTDAGEAEHFWRSLDRDVERLDRPVHVLLTVHWHERSAEAVLERYRAVLWRPEQPTELPSGVEALLVRGSDWVEALFYLQPWRALVVGDLLVGGAGGVRVPVDWFPTEEQDWARADLKERLRQAVADRDVELVLVSHGDPVLEGGREALERALAGSLRRD
jgi:glyoxylase-like metal-dependent hydrolase (beta-lactamase superfamily II)